MENNENQTVKTELMPMLPLRGMSVFPGMILNFDVERPISVAALNAALAGDQMLFLAAQKDIMIEQPGEDDVYSIGTICKLKQLLRIPGSNTVRVMVEGVSRAKMRWITTTSPCSYAEIERVSDAESEQGSAKAEAMLRRCRSLFEEYAHLSGTISPELMLVVVTNENVGYVADYITQNIYLRHSQKQVVLEELRPLRRLSVVCGFLRREIGVLKIDRELQHSMQEQVSRSQKEYYLREQLKVIQSELGGGDDGNDELDEYRDRIFALKFEESVEDKLLREVNRLAKQPQNSSEGAVIRTYLDTILELPWHKSTKERLDIAKAMKILDADHFGLSKVKERIIETLAVKQLTPSLKGSVLCLVGPPGVGKTSIGFSIARATNRKLSRISLGGVHDEAEIRGHRKTYVGAMPGRIIAGINQAGSSNALLLLDEIDKLGSDYRGDPAAALLEALDAEQNHAFRDHYIEIPFDLSDVMFITTANTTDTIPRALLDRMEVIELPSYTAEEKLRIAKDHLLPKQRKKHGLSASQLALSDDAIREIISLYTRESGVRVLERSLASVCRKTAKKIAEGSAKSLKLKAGMIEDLLGSPKYKPDPVCPADEVGLVRGLAWTSTGGEMLDVEVGVMDGSGKLELTGNLGHVMKESAQAAISYIRSRAGKLGIDPDFHKDKDIHIHFPEGAVPKDGPSAGITICIGVISALTGIPVKRSVAMTGEITLRGRILPIGGLREKTMAALRAGVHDVIIPAANEPDLEEIDPTVRSALSFVMADHVDKILSVALNRRLFDAGNEDLSESEDRGLPSSSNGGEQGSPVAIRQ